MAASMKLIALMPVRNEAWCLGLSARVALRWCDELICLDHASTDNSPQIMADLECEFPDRFFWLGEPNPAWNEMRHRQSLLDFALRLEPTHIAIIDADEVLTGGILPHASSYVHETKPGEILQFPLFNLRGSLNRYHASGVWGRRIVSVALADSPEVRWHGDRFHSREPLARYKSYRPLQSDEGGVMHLWGASERRLIAKHALYKVTERLRWPAKPVGEIDALYSLAIHGGPNSGSPATWTYADVPSGWWEPYADLMQYLDVDAEPWQEAEVRRLVVAHGKETFAGLDLFSVG